MESEVGYLVVMEGKGKGQKGRERRDNLPQRVRERGRRGWGGRETANRKGVGVACLKGTEHNYSLCFETHILKDGTFFCSYEHTGLHHFSM